MTQTVITLTQLPIGSAGRLDPGQVVGQAGLAADDAGMLRAMGLHPNATVRLCRLGDPCIVQVGRERGDSCRLGVARRIAERITVCVAPEVCSGTRRA